MVGTVRRLDQSLEGATEASDVVLALEQVAVSSLHAQGDPLLADSVQGEGAVEQPDERAQRAGCGVVLGHAEEQRAAALHVTEVDVVAEGAPTCAAPGVDEKHQLGLGVVPGREAGDADLRAVADRGEHGCLGEDLGVRPQTHLQVLRPHALGEEHLLDMLRGR